MINSVYEVEVFLSEEATMLTLDDPSIGQAFDDMFIDATTLAYDCGTEHYGPSLRMYGTTDKLDAAQEIETKLLALKQTMDNIVKSNSD